MLTKAKRVLCAKKDPFKTLEWGAYKDLKQINSSLNNTSLEKNLIAVQKTKWEPILSFCRSKLGKLKELK